MERLNVIPILTVEGHPVRVAECADSTTNFSSRSSRLFDAERPALHEGLYNNLSEIRSRFRTFDAKQATCFKLEDRERLLAVIESGFGSLDNFNMLVSGLFDLSQLRTSQQQEEVMAFAWVDSQSAVFCSGLAV